MSRSREVENSGSEVAGVKKAEGRVGQRQRGNSIERKHRRYLTVKNGSVSVHTETGGGRSPDIVAFLPRRKLPACLLPAASPLSLRFLT